MSTKTDTYYYQLTTPLRSNRYLTSHGTGAVIYGDATPTESSEWKLVQREDGSIDIVNRADHSFISPNSSSNTALKTSSTSPSAGWTFSPAATSGYYIITSGTAQINQTNAGLNWKIYNWGDGTNTTDTGCQYAFALTDHIKESTAIAPVAATTPQSITVENGYIKCSLPYRLYSLEGKALPVHQKLPAGTYLVQTAHKTLKVNVGGAQ